MNNSPTSTPSRALHYALWTLQILLALAFGMVGLMKLTQSPEAIAESDAASVLENYGIGLFRFIGLAELLGALGLVLPAALRILPGLTPLAASGISLIMGLACGYHAALGESILPTAVLFFVAAFVAWGRWRLAPIARK